MANRQIKAENTSMSFGRGFDTLTEEERRSRDNLVKTADGKIREYLVTSWDHDEDSDLIENQALSPGRGGVPDEINYLWGSGPFSVQVPSENGYLDLIQPLLNDPNPVSVAIPKKTLIPKATNLSDIIAAEYFTGTTDVTVKAVDAMPLGNTLTVVDDQNLSGAGNKTVANDLSTLPQSLTLTVTPNSDAALTNTATPGTIVISYEDADGESQTIELTFADGVKTVAQTVTFPECESITSVQATGWSAGKFSITAGVEEKYIALDMRDYADELTLTVTPSGTATLTNARVDGTITLTYTDADGESQTIELTFADGMKTDAKNGSIPCGCDDYRGSRSGLECWHI